MEKETSKRSYSEAFGDDEKSPISILNEYAQKRGLNQPEFKWLEAEQNKQTQEWTFTCSVKLNSVKINFSKRKHYKNSGNRNGTFWTVKKRKQRLTVN